MDFIKNYMSKKGGYRIRMFLDAVIETDRLVIRPYCLENLDELYSAVSEGGFR